MRSEVGEVLEFSRAVADLFGTHSHTIQQWEMQVRHRCVIWINEASPGFQTAVTMAYQQNRKVRMGMAITVGKPAAVNEQRVVEQGAVAILSGLEPPDEVGKQLDMECVDLCELLHPLRIVAMMRERMMRIGNADLAISPDTALAADHHCRHAGQVRLKCQHLEIIH